MMKKKSKDPFEDMRIVSSYTREQAIEDGMLVDVSKQMPGLVGGAGFKVPLVITAGVHGLCEVPEDLIGLQDYSGQLWDVLWLARTAFKAALIISEEKARHVEFEVIFQVRRTPGKAYPMPASGRAHGALAIIVKLWICFTEHEGFTIMLPEEY